MAFYKKNHIAIYSYEYSLEVIKLSKELSASKTPLSLVNQFLRSGTSIGANIEEAIGGISRKEYIYRLSIAYREARESKYWLRLLYDSECISLNQFEFLYSKCDRISKALYMIMKNCKEK